MEATPVAIPAKVPVCVKETTPPAVPFPYANIPFALRENSPKSTLPVAPV